MLKQDINEPFPVRKSDTMDTKMGVQRLTIRAATGKLKIIPVWRCLARSGANVVRWNVRTDHNDGMDSMTVDIVEADPLRTEEIAAALGRPPLEMTVTASIMTVISTSRSASDVFGDFPTKCCDFAPNSSRPGLKLTVVGNAGNHCPPRTCD
ncbi:hypothetical protein PWR63_30290 [Paraburkholderia sp. A2WS-5]|uniref:hypothetical protein n=1 Tax=unclassified Paraburkholderia TaxID=2615204 RepID=UPI003B77C9FC